MSAIPFALGSLLCPFMVFAVVIIVIIKLVQSAQRSGSRTVAGGPVQSSNVATELGADGFWILSCPVAPSSMIYYYYWSAGTRHAAQVPYQPGPDGRQFVYTGVRPEQVSIIRIVQQSDDDGGVSGSIIPGIIVADAILSSTSSDDSSPPPPPQSAPPSFPSAY